MAAEPVFHYKRTGLEFAVHENRIEVKERGGFLGMGGKQVTIPLRSVSTAEVEGFAKKLTVKTNDGKTYQWQLGTHGPEAREAIVERL